MDSKEIEEQIWEGSKENYTRFKKFQQEVATGGLKNANNWDEELVEMIGKFIAMWSYLEKLFYETKMAEENLTAEQVYDKFAIKNLPNLYVFRSNNYYIQLMLDSLGCKVFAFGKLVKMNGARKLEVPEDVEWNVLTDITMSEDSLRMVYEFISGNICSKTNMYITFMKLIMQGTLKVNANKIDRSRRVLDIMYQNYNKLYGTHYDKIKRFYS